MSSTVERQLSRGPITHVEQRLVKRLAPLVPDFISPNRITLVSIISGMLTGVSLFFAAKWRVLLFAASFFMFIHWMGDALDGAVARYRKKTSKTGFYLDHFFDAVILCAVFIGLYFSNSSDTALPLIFACFYMLMEINILLQAILFGNFNISISIFGPAEASFLFIFVNTVSYFFPRIFGYSIWDIVIILSIIGVLPAFINIFLKTVKQTRFLDRQT